jgi:hypothetical protein
MTHKKVGGIHFIKIGRVCLAFSMKKKKAKTQKPAISNAKFNLK